MAILSLFLLLAITMLMVGGQQFRQFIFQVTAPPYAAQRMQHLLNTTSVKYLNLGWSGNFHPLFPANLDGKTPSFGLSLPFVTRKDGCCVAGDCVIGDPLSIQRTVLLLWRGNCTYYEKFLNAQRLKAAGVLVANINSEDFMLMSAPPQASIIPVTIPGAAILKEFGDFLESLIRDKPSGIEVDVRRYVPSIDDFPWQEPGYFHYDFIKLYGGNDTAECALWKKFLLNLNATVGAYNLITLSGQYDVTGVSCRDPSVVEGLRVALKTGTPYSALCDGRQWVVDYCSGGIEITTNPSGRTCQCSFHFVSHSVRPCTSQEAWVGYIDGGWGGIGTETCNPPNQWMQVQFRREANVAEVFEEDFNTRTVPYGWKVYDWDRDGYTWMFNGIDALDFTYLYPRDEVLQPDDWLVTPALYLRPSNKTSHPIYVNFSYQALDQDFPKEKMQLWINFQGPQPSDFLQNGSKLHDWQTENTDKSLHTVDLTSFAYPSRSTWLSWRHHQNTSGGAVQIASVLVHNARRIPLTPAPDLSPLPLVSPSPSTSPSPKTSASPGLSPNISPAPDPSPLSDCPIADALWQSGDIDLDVQLQPDRLRPDPCVANVSRSYFVVLWTLKSDQHTLRVDTSDTSARSLSIGVYHPGTCSLLMCFRDLEPTKVVTYHPNNESDGFVYVMLAAQPGVHTSVKVRAEEGRAAVNPYDPMPNHPKPHPPHHTEEPNFWWVFILAVVAFLMLCFFCSIPLYAMVRTKNPLLQRIGLPSPSSPATPTPSPPAYMTTI